MFVIPIADEIRKQRIHKGLDMKALSLKAGLPFNAILRIEKGQSLRTSHLRAIAISEALGCKIEDIFIIPNKTEKRGA